MMQNNFLNFVNRSIGDTARFARDFQAHPEKYVHPKQPSASDQMAQMMPMMMLMMFQMLMGQNTQGLMPPPGAYYPPWLGGPVNPNLPGTPGDPGAGGAPRNPAIGYLENLFQSKAASQTNGSSIALSDQDVAKIRSDLSQGSLKTTDLGQALKYELDRAPNQHLPAVSRLITDLMDSGELNIGPFLQNDYLNQLSSGRQDTLLQAVELAGLRMDSGKPNTRFIGFMLAHLNRSDQPQTQNLLRRFLQDFYAVHGNTPDTPVGKILASVLQLADLHADPQGHLQFVD